MTLSWERDGRNWPHRAASRFVAAGDVRWHVQVMGAGEDLLLVHGSGASTHSWRRLMPVLAARFRVIAVDLPGHGFSSRLSARGGALPRTAAALAALLTALPARPAVVAGHSAGVAILARMCLDGAIQPRALISLNGAVLPLGGLNSSWFAPLAKAMAALPIVPWAFSRRASSPQVVRQLLRSTGSTLDAEGEALYGTLVRDAGHVAGTLDMMAGWDLHPLARELPRLTVPLLVVVGSNDRTVPPVDAERLQRLVPGATLVRLPGLGHLAHEERPEEAARLILQAGLGPVASAPVSRA